MIRSLRRSGRNRSRLWWLTLFIRRVFSPFLVKLGEQLMLTLQVQTSHTFHLRGSSLLFNYLLKRRSAKRIVNWRVLTQRHMTLWLAVDSDLSSRGQ